MEKNPVQKALALFDFKARKPGQLSFNREDTVTILATVNKNKNF